MTLAGAARTALRLGRPVETIPAWTGALAGALLAWPGAPAERVALAAAGVAAACWAGAALDDAFDAPLDALLRPSRPVPAGRLERESAWALGLSGLVVSVTLLAGVGARLGASAGLALAGVVLLCATAREGGAAGPSLLALCRALAYAAAGLAVCGRLTRPCALACALLGAYAWTLGACRRPGGGPAPPLCVPLLLLPVAACAPALAGDHARCCLWFVALAWVGRGCVRLLDRDLERALLDLTAALPLLDAMLLARLGLTRAVWLAAAGFPVMLLLQRRRA